MNSGQQTYAENQKDCIHMSTFMFLLEGVGFFSK